MTSIDGAARKDIGLIPDPMRTPTLTVPEAGILLGLSRPSAYEAARRGDIPVLKLGRRLVVPTASLLRILGIES
ncbi:MAG TPA: helix-turn-helix domain-containing protein [Streptosporangiaceae bacterium]|jgi:excisionase family DNA binding protein